jgi:hypothetical protein
MSDEEERKQPVRVTREELYRQVWETPIRRLAVQYGISGNGLAKICDRLKVPYPPRGYWAKKAAGKKVIDYRLPPPDDDTPQEVTIIPTPPPLKPPKLAPEVEEKVETARSQAERSPVPKRLTKPHPVIAGWLANHERRKEEARRERDPWIKRMMTPEEFTGSNRRQHRILDALFKELERQGGRVKEDDRRRVFAEMNGEPIMFQIREKQKQVRRPLNEDEKRWRSASDKDWKQELQPTGKLVFTIKTWLPNGLRTEWLENDAKPMETLLPEIVATFVAAGPLLVEQRCQREKAERQRQIAERQRYEEQQRRKLDANRWRHFVEIAHQWRDAEIARAFVAQLKRLDYDEDEEIAGNRLSDWIIWAEEHAHSTDPLNHGVEGIFNSVGKITTWSYRD